MEKVKTRTFFCTFKKTLGSNKPRLSHPNVLKFIPESFTYINVNPSLLFHQME